MDKEKDIQISHNLELDANQDDSYSGNFEDSFSETENVEIIEFSESEHDDEECELILPDDQNYFLQESTEAACKSNESYFNIEEHYAVNDDCDNMEIKKSQSIEDEALVVCENSGEKSEIKFCGQNIIDNANLLKKENDTLKNENDEKSLRNAQECSLNTKPKEHSLDTTFENKSKSTEEREMRLNEKSGKGLHNNELNNSLENKQRLISTGLEECKIDPLAMENKNTTVDEIKIVDDGTDDVEIIEMQDCPILIESDEEDKTEKQEYPKEIRCYAVKSTNPNKAYISNLKAEIMQKSKSSASKTKKKISKKLTQPKNVPSNVKNSKVENLQRSKSNSSKILKETSKKLTQRNNFLSNIKNSKAEKMNKCKSISSKTLKKTAKELTQTNFLSNIDLQPSKKKDATPIGLDSCQQTSANPRCFETNVGKKTLLIPNAFYGLLSQKPPAELQSSTKEHKISSKSPYNLCTDAAHCDWLENFLKNFCSPHNIVHNSAYLLLKRTLREEDYELIYKKRSELNPVDNNMAVRLLRKLRYIFYINGDHFTPRLTYIGRKLCQSAFVNIADKTISLTTDKLTNVVTSRTRITTSTLEAKRAEMLTQTNSENIRKPSGTNLFHQYSSPPNINLPPTLQKNTEVDAQSCPPRKFSNITADDSPRRSLRTIKLPQNSYSEDNKDNNSYQRESNKKEKQIPRNEKRIFTAETEKFITRKRLAADKKRQKMAKSFETAFIDAISFNSEPRVSQPKRAPIAPKSLTTCYSMPKNSPNAEGTSGSECLNDGSALPLSTSLPADAEVFVISDDEDKDDDVQVVPLVSTDEPRAHVIHKIANVEQTINAQGNREGHSAKLYSNTSREWKEVFQIPTEMICNGEVKNISSKIHSKSIFTEICVLCSRQVSKVVDHYVNSHPEHEVFTSRPSPKMLRRLFYEGIGVASYDRLQNGLGLYVATCVFCKKRGSFTLSYWYQHFALHTGEYAFECTGCGVRKPTRSQINYHVRQNCTRKGQVKVNQTYDTRLLKISACTCKLCNFTQLNFANMVKHFQKQHEVENIENFDWAQITLLDLTSTAGKARRYNDPKNIDHTAENNTIYVSGGDNEIFEINEVEYPDCALIYNEQPLVVNEAEGDNDEEEDFDVWRSNPPYNSNLTVNDLKYDINIE